MATPQPTVRRVDAMHAQLHKASEEYVAAKDAYDAARIEYDVAREKFASVRRIASNVLSATEWWTWRIEHENTQYTGLKLGEAVVDALEGHAYSAALRHWKTNQPYAPTMSLEDLAETLERGGFEFRSTSRLREVNAGVLNLDRVERTAGGYKVKDTDDILETMKPEPPKPKKPVADGPSNLAVFAADVVQGLPAARSIVTSPEEPDNKDDYMKF